MTQVLQLLIFFFFKKYNISHCMLIFTSKSISTKFDNCLLITIQTLNNDNNNNNNNNNNNTDKDNIKQKELLLHNLHVWEVLELKGSFSYFTVFLDSHPLPKLKAIPANSLKPILICFFLSKSHFIHFDSISILGWK